MDLLTFKLQYYCSQDNNVFMYTFGQVLMTSHVVIVLDGAILILVHYSNVIDHTQGAGLKLDEVSVSRKAWCS